MKKNIPWHLAVPPEVFCEKTNIEISDYYLIPAKRLETHIKAREYFLRRFNHDIGLNIPNGNTSYWNAAVLGAKVEFDGNNQAAVHERVLSRAEDVRRLKVPGADEIPNLSCYKMLLQQHKEMLQLAKGTSFKASFGSFGFQGPFTTATILRGTDIMMDILTEPDLIKELLDKIVETQCNVMAFSEKEFGIHIESCGMGDDYSGLISPASYAEFCYPYMKALYEKYGIKQRSLHCETLKRGHLKYLKMLKIDNFDPGVDEDLTVEDILEELPDTIFTFNLFTVRDMVNGTPESIRNLYSQYVRRGAPSIMTELTVGTPEENIQAFLKVAREFE